MHFLHVVLILKLRFTYEVSPVFVLMEEVLLKKMQSIVGWSDDEGDGIFCPGEYKTLIHKLKGWSQTHSWTSYWLWWGPRFTEQMKVNQINWANQLTGTSLYFLQVAQCLTCIASYWLDTTSTQKWRPAEWELFLSWSSSHQSMWEQLHKVTELHVDCVLCTADNIFDGQMYTEFKSLDELRGESGCLLCLCLVWDLESRFSLCRWEYV